MPSPFPGMDPYLESHWRDVHSSLVVYVRDALQDVLPGDLRARVEERVVFESDEGWGNSLFPDVRVVEGPPQQGSVVNVMRLSGSEQPILVDAEREPLTEGYIEVVDVGTGHRIVTIIEVLSPTNRLPGEGRQEYQRKQREICQSKTNLVEIDLLRSGRHVLAVPALNIPSRRGVPYMVCVRRAAVPGRAEIYPIGLLQKLPTVKIPLRPTDQDVPLGLQALIEQCYRKGRYEGDIDYRKDPEPPWSKAEVKVATNFLREKGFRRPAPRKRKR